MVLPSLFPALPSSTGIRRTPRISAPLVPWSLFLEPCSSPLPTVGILYKTFSQPISLQHLDITEYNADLPLVTRYYSLFTASLTVGILYKNKQQRDI